jgi:hypothetical protein
MIIPVLFYRISEQWTAIDASCFFLECARQGCQSPVDWGNSMNECNLLSLYFTMQYRDCVAHSLAWWNQSDHCIHHNKAPELGLLAVKIPQSELIPTHSYSVWLMCGSVWNQEPSREIPLNTRRNNIYFKINLHKGAQYSCMMKWYIKGNGWEESEA